MASFTVMLSTSLMSFPPYLTSSMSCLKRLPLQASQVRVRSAINCISMVTYPAPLHSSHLPPSALKEKYCGVKPICLARWLVGKERADGIVGLQISGRIAAGTLADRVLVDKLHVLDGSSSRLPLRQYSPGASATRSSRRRRAG